MNIVRFGVLGAASVAPYSLIRHVQRNPEAEVVGIASRDVRAAARYARKYHIPRVHQTYQHVVDDPDINAIYIPLPTALHGRWTLAGIAAGKHVLCEKPLAANAEEARHVAQVAAGSGLVVAEAFHSLMHPMWQRIEHVVLSGTMGRIERIDAAFSFPLPFRGNFRRDFDLGGGALLDIGCYPVGFVCELGGLPEVVAAGAKLFSPEVDRAMAAELRFASGAQGRITASMWSLSRPRFDVRVLGADGELRAYNPVSPQNINRIVIRDKQGHRWSERATRRPTYAYQLDAFIDAVLRGTPMRTTAANAVTKLAAIDAIYDYAGLRPRCRASPRL
jgi:predicted dehydrogenase